MLTNLSAAKCEIDGMIERGVEFDLIEAHIDQLALPQDGKTALWLLAWGHQTEAVRESTLAVALVDIAG